MFNHPTTAHVDVPEIGMHAYIYVLNWGMLLV